MGVRIKTSIIHVVRVTHGEQGERIFFFFFLNRGALNARNRI